MMLIVD